jgi:hypothetical protein
MPRRERLPGAPQPCLAGVGKDPGGREALRGAFEGFAEHHGRLRSGTV